MATISNTPRPGYAWDATDNCWYPIGTGPHTHSDYITQSTAINPSIVDAKGDLIVGSTADTVIRKPVGTDGQLLYADSTATGGIKWDAAPASGSMTLLSTTTLSSGSSTTISSISQSYTNLFILTRGVSVANSNDNIKVRYNGSADAFYGRAATNNGGTQTNALFSYQDFRLDFGNATLANSANNSMAWTIYSYTNSTARKAMQGAGQYESNGAGNCSGTWGGVIMDNAPITSMTIATGSTFNGGTVLIYGVN